MPPLVRRFSYRMNYQICDYASTVSVQELAIGTKQTQDPAREAMAYWFIAIRY